MTQRLRQRLFPAGISVVELMVGVTLLGLVVISLVAASLYASRTITRSRVELEAAEFQQSELERILAIPYSDLASGTRSLSKGTSSWAIEDSVRYRRILLVTDYSPTEEITAWDTVVAYRLRP